MLFVTIKIKGYNISFSWCIISVYQIMTISKPFANAYSAAERGFIDEVILPHNTRRKLIKAFTMLENKAVVKPNRKHGNIPL